MGFYVLLLGSVGFRGFPCAAAMVGRTDGILFLWVSMGFRELVCIAAMRV